MHEPDLKIQIMDRSGTLYFHIQSHALGIEGADYGGIQLQDHRRFINHYLRSFKNPDAYLAEPIARGRVFFAVLPERLQALIWSSRKLVKSLWVVSRQAWLPWELMWITNPDHGEVEDGGFLGLHFDVAHWCVEKAPPRHLHLRKAAVVTSPGIHLMDDSHRYLTEITNIPFDAVDPEYDLLVQAMTHSSWDVWQFIGHNHSYGDTADESSFELYANKQLTPQSLLSKAGRVGQNHPLVFMASCQSALEGPALEGTGGWPRRFTDAGASAFIGTYWPIPPHDFLVFAAEFYPRLKSGLPIARAMREARHAITQPDQPDYFALSFALFAHPLATVQNTATDVITKEDQAEPSPAVQITPLPKLPISKKWMYWLVNKRHVKLALVFTGVCMLALVLGLWLMGRLALRSREYLLRLGSLDYPFDTTLWTGLDVFWSMRLRSLGVLFSESPPFLYGAWTLAVGSLLLLFYAPRQSRFLMGLSNMVWLLVLGGSLFLATLTVRAQAMSSVEQSIPKFSANMADRIAFRGHTWLADGSGENDRHRDNVQGFTWWLLIACLAGFFLATRERGVAKFWFGTLFSTCALLTLTLLPKAYAYAEWGWKYPLVSLQQVPADLLDGLPFSNRTCCLFDVSAGAKTMVIYVICEQQQRVEPIWKPPLAIRTHIVGKGQPPQIILHADCANL